MEGIFRVSAIAAAGALCAVALRKYNPELALVLGMMTAALLFFTVADQITNVLKLVIHLGETAGVEDDLLVPLIKVTGIAIITNLTVQTCREAGEQAVASAAELAGAVFALTAALPLMQTVLTQVEGLL